MKKSRPIFSYLASISFLIGCLLLFFLVAATSSTTMHLSFEKYSLSSLHGIHPQNYSYIAQEITAYLKGEISSVAFSLPVQGEVVQVFNQKELLHLKDILHLVSLGKIIVFSLFTVFLFSFFVVFYTKNLSSFFTALFKSCVGAFLFIALLALWALIDFNSLFTFFHQILFTNDLWLLNPYTDKLIQLMPLPFFIAYGQKILIGVLLLLLFLASFSYFILKFFFRQRS